MQSSLEMKTHERTNYSFLTALLFWAGLVVVGSNYIAIPLITTFSEVYQVSQVQAAWSGTIFSLFYATGSLLSGPLSDRFGRKQVMLYGMFLLAWITVAIPFVDQFWWIILLRGGQGLVAASFAPVALAYIVDIFPVDKVVTTIGFVSSAFLISGIVGQIVSDFISLQFGWGSVFYFLGIIYLLTAVLLLYFLPKSPVAKINVNMRAMLHQFRMTLSDKNLMRAYLIALTLLLSFVAYYTILGGYLVETYQMTDTGIIFVRVAGIIGMVFSPLAGFLSNRFGLVTMLRSSLLLAVAGIALSALGTNLSALVVMSIIFVTGIALTVPTLISIVGILGGENRGAAVSVYVFILFIGTSLGPIVAITFMRAGSYVLSFCLLAIILGVGLVISMFIRSESL